VRPSLHFAKLAILQKNASAPFAFSAPSGHATKRAGYRQRLLMTRYSAARSLCFGAKVGYAGINRNSLQSEMVTQHTTADMRLAHCTWQASGCLRIHYCQRLAQTSM
jgi:hypothetical protein